MPPYELVGLLRMNCTSADLQMLVILTILCWAFIDQRCREYALQVDVSQRSADQPFHVEA